MQPEAPTPGEISGLTDLEHLGIASNDTKITVFLHLAVATPRRPG
jgi:hypothetical protein